MIAFELAISLRAVISQRLIRTKTGGRVPAVEVLLNTQLVSEMIERGDFTGVKEAIEKSMSEGSQSFEQDIARLIGEGLVTRDEGLANADSPTNLMWRLANDSATRSKLAPPTTTSLALGTAGRRRAKASSKRAVFLRDQHVVLARGNQENPLFHLDLAPIAQLLRDGMNPSTLLAAVAGAWSLDIAPLLIRAGLKNFGQKTHSVSAPTHNTSVV